MTPPSNRAAGVATTLASSQARKPGPLKEDASSKPESVGLRPSDRSALSRRSDRLVDLPAGGARKDPRGARVGASKGNKVATSDHRHDHAAWPTAGGPRAAARPKTRGMVGDAAPWHGRRSRTISTGTPRVGAVAARPGAAVRRQASHGAAA
jgi:hypothetical protein